MPLLSAYSRRLTSNFPFAGRGAKALETNALPETLHETTPRDPVTADEFIQRALDTKPRKKLKQTAPEPPTTSTTPSHYATLTLINNAKPPGLSDVQQPKTTNPQVPPNIEAGSLVVLTVNDPKSPTKKMLQTYISRGAGQLTPVALPPTLLNSVVGYMKKGTPRGTVSTDSSPQLLSPTSVGSVDSRTAGATTPSVIQVNPTHTKRQRLSSYTITQL
ncbi:hypothetical protein MSG28_008661 [Choristoneura fumiferana]|uniref:Uncharacterized protein n=1 Tax=Choristoneura fumiferana TaxID=7141 RepID=A0ACC0J7P9_CHOFU|nr:hypothetical protein MSG28_008661 [Choristoneura fumiferana]